MKIDRDALSDHQIIMDYIYEFGITSMTKEQKELMKRLAKSLLERQIKMREGDEG
jgi:hypothetical protein